MRRGLVSRHRFQFSAELEIPSRGNVSYIGRRLTIRTNPPGALVFIDGQEIGRTPVATPFTYYGTRKIRIVKDGYETMNVTQPFAAPWYQVPPLDFISENLAPQELRDEREVYFELAPKSQAGSSDVLIQANQLRSMANSEAAMNSGG